MGTAAQLLRIGRATVDIDVDTIFSDAIQIKQVELDSVLLRISEDKRKPGDFNFAYLEPRWETTRTSDRLGGPGRSPINTPVPRVGHAEQHSQLSPS